MKKLFLLVILSLTACITLLAGVGCGNNGGGAGSTEDNDDNPIVVQEIPVMSVDNVRGESLEIFINDTFTLEPTVSYKGAAVEATFTFDSSDKQVATIDSNGLISGLKLGATEITVTATYGEYDAKTLFKKITLTVDKVFTFELSVPAVELYGVAELSGKQFNDTVTVTPSLFIEGVEVTEGFTYTTQDESVATVNAAGVVSGKRVGTTNVICEYDDGGRIRRAVAPVTVSAAIAEKDVEEVLITTGSALSEFDRVFDDGKTASYVADVTDGSEKKVATPTGVIKKFPANGNRVYRVYNDTYAYDVSVLAVDYLITTAEQFKAIVPQLEKDMTMNAYVALGNDIENFGEYDFHTDSREYEFRSTFDGRGHVISGIDVKGYGLFRQLASTGVIKNLAVIDAVQSSEDLGGTLVVGWNYGTIENVYVSGDVSGTSGIALVTVSGGTIKNSMANIHGTHADKYWYTARGAISSFLNSGVTAAAIQNCYAVSDNFEKGLALVSDTGLPITTNFYKTVEELFTAFNGSIPAGFGKPWSIGGEDDLYEVKLVFGDTTVCGVRKKTEITLESGKHELFSFAKTTDDTATYVANNMDGGYYKITLPEQVSGNVVAVKVGVVGVKDFSHDAVTRLLKLNATEISAITSADYTISIDVGTAMYVAPVVVADYVVTTADEFRAVVPALGKAGSLSYQKLIALGNDIENFGEYNYHPELQPGEAEYEFSGTFDGRGYSITGIDVKGYGLFRQLSQYAVVKNLAIIDSTQSSQGLGGAFIVGWNYGTIENVYVSGNASGKSGIAALCGYAWNAATTGHGIGSVNNSIANVHGTHADGWWYTVNGALVGSTSEAGAVNNCYAVSDNFAKGLYLNSTTGNAETTNFYSTTSALLTAFNGSVPTGFNEFWTIKEGNLYFGDNLIIAGA